MPTAALIIALIGSSISVAQNGVTLWASIKAVSKAPVKTSKFVYKKALKPVGRVVIGK